MQQRDRDLDADGEVIDLRLRAEMLAEEQERAIEYLKSAPRKRIQELGRTRRETNNDLMTVNMAGESNSMSTLRSSTDRKRKRNLGHPRSLPRLKEEKGLTGDLSLK